MTDENKEDKLEVAASAADPADKAEDPLKTELEKVQRGTKTRTEKLLYRKRLIDEQLAAEGIEEPEEKPEDDDDKPLTKGEFRKMQAESATKTALQLADEVTNETERELLKYYLQNRIVSTGDPKQDLELARGLVNSVRNKQIIEEQQRRPESSARSSGAGAPANIKKTEELTAEEQAFMKAPWNLTKEQIIASRPVAK